MNDYVNKAEDALRQIFALAIREQLLALRIPYEQTMWPIRFVVPTQYQDTKEVLMLMLKCPDAAQVIVWENE